MVFDVQVVGLMFLRKSLMLTLDSLACGLCSWAFAIVPSFAPSISVHCAAAVLRKGYGIGAIPVAPRLAKTSTYLILCHWGGATCLVYF